jgi:hypothetical protein
MPLNLLEILLFPVAILAAVFGWRGRRVGSQPMCRKCGFNLSGKAASTSRCGECGSDLTHERSVEFGELRRRWVLFTAGAITLIFLGSSWGLSVLTSHLDHAPFKLIVWRANSADEAVRGHALDELIRRVHTASLPAEDWDQIAETATTYAIDETRPWDRRWGTILEQAPVLWRLQGTAWQGYLNALLRLVSSGSQTRREYAAEQLRGLMFRGILSKPQVARFADGLLACQAEPKLNWVTDWGDTLEMAHDLGRLSPQQWTLYLSQACQNALAIELPKSVRVGEPLKLWVEFASDRCGRSSVDIIHVYNMRLDWTDHPGAGEPAGTNEFDSVLSGANRVVLELKPADFPKRLTAGVQHVHVTATFTVDPQFPCRQPTYGTVGQVDLPGTFVLTSQ